MAVPDAPPEPVSADAVAPRRTRGGRILIGPSLAARFRPLAVAGLPLISLVLAFITGAALRRWAAAHAATSDLAAVLVHAVPAFLVAFLVTWALLAVWALVPLALTRSVVELDPAARTIRRRRGLRAGPAVPLGRVLWAVGDPGRDGMAGIGISAPDAPGAVDAADAPDEPGAPAAPGALEDTWAVPNIGWDGESYEGLRALQREAGLPVDPPHRELARQALAARLADHNAQAAARLGMPWRPEYAEDRVLFERDFDEARRAAAAARRQAAGGRGGRA